ncbi:MAG: hypothetical protein ACRDVW_10945, partial [Acidimicrobiales bacterium]
MSPVSSASRAEWSRRLARALVAGAFVSEADVATYLVQATENNIPLSVILVQREPHLRDVVLNTLGQLTRMRVVDLEMEPPVGDVRQLLPPMLALEHRAIPLRLAGDQVVTAFAEPPEADDVATLAGVLGHEIVAVLANPVLVDRMVQPAEAHAGNGHASGHQSATATVSERVRSLESLPPLVEEPMPRHARTDDPPVPIRPGMDDEPPPPPPVLTSVPPPPAAPVTEPPPPLTSVPPPPPPVVVSAPVVE